AINKVPLTQEYQLDVPAIAEAISENTKLIFLCSPNNPTGNSLNRLDVEAILNNYFGIVVIDEAYINFSRYRSLTPSLGEYPNLVILQTLSKAWGLAALRVGMAFADSEIVDVMNRIKPPYNINQASQDLALQSLDRVEEVNNMIHEIVNERKFLQEALPAIKVVEKINPSDANFLLVKVTEPVAVYQFLLSRGIVVRDRSRVELCEGCLRITIGTPEENKILIKALNDFKV
ncbi:MAG: aminotransferase class I/II-fold pyridoxal phosphate-dependent enzyme, partial [Flavitalea sp.]